MKTEKHVKTAIWVFIMILFAELFFSQQFVSMTFDEPLHTPAGYSKLMTGDYRMTTEHPPLIQIIESLPLLFLKPKLNLDDKSWTNKNMMEFTKRFFFVDNKNPRQLLEYSRIPIIILTILLAILVYKWTNKLFGATSALLALAIYVFEPNILAHGTLATTDMGFTFFSFLAIYYYWKFCTNQSTINLILAGATIGLAQLSKYTAIFLWPAYALIAIITITQTKNKRKQQIYFHIKSLVVIAIITLFIINATYLFKGTGIPIKKAMLEDSNLNKGLYSPEKVFGSNKIINFIAEKIPSPLPYYYTKGLGFVINEGKNPSPNMIFGTKYEKGVWHYFIDAFISKTTLAFLALLLLAIFLPQKNNEKLEQNWQFLLIPAAIIFIALSSVTKQTGIRYILAIFPFLIVWMSGRITTSKLYDKKYFKFAIIGLIVLHAGSSVNAFPAHLSYYNEAFGMENGWKYFTDSNTDWGQDFDKLRQYVQCNPTVKIQYFGTQDLEFYGLDKNKASQECEKEILAISVSKTKDEKLSWLEKHKPFKKIGNSILLYNITKCD